MMRVRLGSAVLLIFGLLAVVASITLNLGHTPSYPLVVLVIGLVLIVFSLDTIRIRSLGGVLQD
ncbi:MAG: hypothetical protein KGD60_03095 [Candidatus Thorarchaeota archaeon]|nr:hypothetical protein [Candidatus Thorarchaeota archaeon]